MLLCVVVDDDNTELITAGSLVTLSVVLLRTSLGDGDLLELGPMSSDPQQVRYWEAESSTLEYGQNFTCIALKLHPQLLLPSTWAQIFGGYGSGHV